MKITEQALEAINNKTTRNKLALALNFTERWIIKCISENKSNGPLTTAAALQVIREETDFTNDQILEKESLGVRA
jgi:phage repressor protein C with HTH and peptisase S24 domain